MYVCVCVHAYIRQYIDHHKHTCSNTFIHSCIIYTFTPYTHTHTHAGMIGKNLLAVQDMRYAHIHTICTHTHTYMYTIHTHTYICRYDWQKSPCDPRYAPPEQFIDDVHWAKYDLYCVGLILVSMYVSMYICAIGAVRWRCALAKYDLYCVGLILVSMYVCLYKLCACMFIHV